MWSRSLSVCVNWFPVNSGLLGVVFACYQTIWKSYLAFLLDLLGKLDASFLFVQVFMKFIDRKKYSSFVGIVAFFVLQQVEVQPFWIVL